MVAARSVVGSPNGPVVNYADETQEFQWDPDYDGRSDDQGYW